MISLHTRLHLSTSEHILSCLSFYWPIFLNSWFEKFNFLRLLSCISFKLDITYLPKDLILIHKIAEILRHGNFHAPSKNSHMLNKCWKWESKLEERYCLRRTSSPNLISIHWQWGSLLALTSSIILMMISVWLVRASLEGWKELSYALCHTMHRPCELSPMVFGFTAVLLNFENSSWYPLALSMSRYKLSWAMSLLISPNTIWTCSI